MQRESSNATVTGGTRIDQQRFAAFRGGGVFSQLIVST